MHGASSCPRGPIEDMIIIDQVESHGTIAMLPALTVRPSRTTNKSTFMLGSRVIIMCLDEHLILRSIYLFFVMSKRHN